MAPSSQELEPPRNPGRFKLLSAENWDFPKVLIAWGVADHGQPLFKGPVVARPEIGRQHVDAGRESCSQAESWAEECASPAQGDCLLTPDHWVRFWKGRLRSAFRVGSGAFCRRR